ncbi:TetR/AcrR family transcriptional regulator [Anoxynatronum buryatiense]|uniref:Transcriptional regulator, TetR family n=1 Tax=Anoxynatronum buryatiense TaxID=489973 RepID=A0AA45WXV2_9CLOT|nr:TetR/AcrR family transcriptional regulator [Anoxynatronum buryatiense]SMP65970.1 transcriptional regulator, TetR family [Anoxynatronum buryatiense]
MKNKEQSELSKTKIIEVACKEFSQKGYANVSLEEIVQQTGLTRGSLYHHFKSKKGLFQAVVEELQNKVAKEVEKKAILQKDPWQALISGSMAFIQTMLNDEYRRILIVDAPTVLGWSMWEEIDDEHSEKHLKEHLTYMVEMGELKDVSIDGLTSILSGSMNEAVMWIGKSKDVETATHEAEVIIEHILRAFKK